MHVVRARNVNEALPIGISYFNSILRCYEWATPEKAYREVSPRGQKRIEAVEPFCTIYERPQERVLFDPVRDANPFFHFMESLWILDGRRDVRWLEQWLPTIKDYSDDGEVFHGAYGYRLRWYGQLDRVIDRLQTEPDSTRCVLQIYDAASDCEYTGKDMPCNCTVFLTLRDEVLDLTVANRSNDLIWGTYGANVVQFSMLQEYIAGWIGAKMGRYIQFSNNTHIYPDNAATKRCLKIDDQSVDDPYAAGEVKPYPLMQTHGDTWNHDLSQFMQIAMKDEVLVHTTFMDPFFNVVARPIAGVHAAYRDGDLEFALDLCHFIMAKDWRRACTEWLDRRIAKRKEKSQ